MRIRKILLEIKRECSHIVECPRFEVAVRRAVNPPDTKFRIHSRNPADCADSNYAEYSDWKHAWGELKSEFGSIVNDVFDAVTFQEEFEATVERDGEMVAPDMSEVINDNWEPLTDINGVGDDLAQKLFKSGLQSIQAVANADLDDLEAIDGIGVALAKRIRKNARELAETTDPVDEESAPDHETSGFSMPVPPSDD
jgi:predicted flap endonuclease-1-like 5' DNA nuclease